MAADGLNHININAPADLLARVRDFYVDAVGLEEGARPDFGIPGYWLYARGQPVVHLMHYGERGAASPGATGCLDHVAFACSDLQGTERRLNELGVSYRRSDHRAAGLVQLFLRDPIGLGVELNFSL